MLSVKIFQLSFALRHLQGTLWGYLIWLRSSLHHLIVKVFGYSCLDIFLLVLAARIEQITQMGFPVTIWISDADTLCITIYNLFCFLLLADLLTTITWLLTTPLWLKILVAEGWLLHPEFLYMLPSTITSHGMPLHWVSFKFGILLAQTVWARSVSCFNFFIFLSFDEFLKSWNYSFKRTFLVRQLQFLAKVLTFYIAIVEKQTLNCCTTPCGFNHAQHENAFLLLAKPFVETRTYSIPFLLQAY